MGRATIDVNKQKRNRIKNPYIYVISLTNKTSLIIINNQNKFSKRYFVTAETFKNSRIAETGKSIKIIRTYCKFYYTCIKALDFRT